MKRICVYCGSSSGRHPEYVEAARRLADQMVIRGIGLVYGGASVGIMGALADTVLAGGGEVIGVMPQSLIEKEVSHPGLTELKVVGSMHERKALMAELSDSFIALPGGLGTLEELFEALTWSQLGFHRKPCGLLNTRAYYRHLSLFLEHAADQGFIGSTHRNLLLIEDSPSRLLAKIQTYRPPEDKWAEMKN
jgi:uncharacterized protein (TIGR00730 family)